MANKNPTKCRSTTSAPSPTPEAEPALEHLGQTLCRAVDCLDRLAQRGDPQIALAASVAVLEFGLPYQREDLARQLDEVEARAGLELPPRNSPLAGPARVLERIERLEAYLASSDMPGGRQPAATYGSW
jgi:hypothetical protein